MGFITINGRDIEASHVATIETRKDPISEKAEVFITLDNGFVYSAFKGTAAACADYRVAIKVSLGLGSDITPPTVNWVDFNPKNIVIEKGKVTHTEMLWDGKEAESSAFTYSEGDMNIAEFHLGEILGAGVGNTTITANKSGKNESGTVYVTESTDNIMFEHLGSMLPVGGSVMVPLKEKGVSVAWGNIVLHSSDPSVATVNSAGLVNALKAGDTFIIADYKGKRYGFAVTVSASVKNVSYDRGSEPVVMVAKEIEKPKRTRKKKETPVQE